MMLSRTLVSSGIKCISGMRFSPGVVYNYAPIPVSHINPIRQFTKTHFNQEREGHSSISNCDYDSEEGGSNKEHELVDDAEEDLSQIYSDWRNPHVECVEEILKQLQLESVTQSAISEFCGDIENKTDAELVHFFAKASVHYNDTDIILDEDPDLRTLINAVIQRTGNFSYENLLLAVKALNSWPEAIRSYQLRFDVPSDHHHQIRQLFNSLRDESVVRLSGTRSKPELFLSVASAGMAAAFQLAHAWLPVDKTTRGWMVSFPVEVVGKLANKEKGSLRKMKPMDKDLFVDFMRICKKIKVLRPNFHKYYCTVKFVDFLPIMNEDEIGIVSLAFITCNLIGDSTHPMEIKLKTGILNFAKDNIHTIESKNLNSIMGHIHVCMPRQMNSDIIALQKVMVDDGVTERMEDDTLIRIAGMGIKEKMMTRGGIYPPFMEKVALSILSHDRTSSKIGIEMIHLKIMSEMTALHCDTPTTREACRKLLRSVPLVRDMRLVKPVAVAKGLLHMAHLGIYDEEVLNWLFSNHRVSEIVGGERHLLRSVKYGDREGRSGGLGDLLVCLQGMVEVEFLEYEGALITGDVDKLWKHFMHSVTPLQVLEHGPAKLMDRYWIRKGILMHRLLSRLTGGASFVCESYVFPFTGLINYVILLDDYGSPKEIPDWLRLLPQTQTKVAGEGHWVMFSMLHPKHDNVFVLTGGPVALDRVARRAGFTNVTVDLQVLEELEDLEGTSEEEMLKYVSSLLSASCPSYHSSPSNCVSLEA